MKDLNSIELNKRIWKNSLLLEGEKSLKESMLRELAEYYNLSVEEAEKRCEIAAKKYAREWKEKEKRIKEMSAEFMDTDIESFILTKWHYEYCNARKNKGSVLGIQIEALKLAKKLDIKKILDFGAGIGTTALLFAKHGFDVTLADISESMQKFTKWRFNKRNLRANFIDLRKKRLPSETFDFVITVDTLEHIADPIYILRQIRDSMKDKGIIVIRASVARGGNIVGHIAPLDFSKKIRGLGFKKVYFGNRIAYKKVARSNLVNKLILWYDSIVYTINRVKLKFKRYIK